MANVALFLACDESSYMTGVDIVVDGGMKGVVKGDGRPCAERAIAVGGLA